MGNYHWYLKQSLEFGTDPQKAPACVRWDPERPLRLHVVTRSWTSVSYDWGWTTERSPGPDAADGAGVAVIDGGETRRQVRGAQVLIRWVLTFNLLRKSPGDDLPAGRGSSAHVLL